MIIGNKYEKDPSNARDITVRTRFRCPICQRHEQMALKIWIEAKIRYT